MITDEQIAKIEKVAMKATPGPWGWTEYGVGEISVYKEEDIVGDGGIVLAVIDEDIRYAMHKSTDQQKADAAHMAECNPATILALIDRLRAAEDDARRYRWLREECQDSLSDDDSLDVPVLVSKPGVGPSWRDQVDYAIDAAMKEQSQ